MLQAAKRCSQRERLTAKTPPALNPAAETELNSNDFRLTGTVASGGLKGREFSDVTSAVKGDLCPRERNYINKAAS